MMAQVDEVVDCLLGSNHTHRARILTEGQAVPAPHMGDRGKRPHSFLHAHTAIRLTTQTPGQERHAVEMQT